MAADRARAGLGGPGHAGARGERIGGVHDHLGLGGAPTAQVA